MPYFTIIIRSDGLTEDTPGRWRPVIPLNPCDPHVAAQFLAIAVALHFLL